MIVNVNLSTQPFPYPFSSLLVFFFPFSLLIFPWLSLYFLKGHLHLFQGRPAPLGRSRCIAQVVQIPVGERTGKVSVFFPECPKVWTHLTQASFHVFYFQCCVSSTFLISLEYFSFFCYTQTIITWTLGF